MKKITISFTKAIHSSKLFAFIAFMICSSSLLAQTVIDVFPSRVTTKSIVTIVGSDFTSNTSITVSGISIDAITFVSSTEMSFNITQDGATDLIGNISVGGVATNFDLNYIAPTVKVLSNGPTNNFTRITEIFTTYNGFWRSDEYKDNPTSQSNWPNDSHDLLAFTYGGVTYSTGVNDQLLTDNGVSFSPQLFFAYSTDGVTGITQPKNFLATGDLVDGEIGEGTEITSPDILGTTVYDAITDGVNGLDLGTGITNFSETADVQFFSAGGNLGAVDDAVPDFLITQIARAGAADVYYYADAAGNIVGRPIEIKINEDEGEGEALLAKWRLDLFDFPNGINYGLATPSTRIFGASESRPLRVVGFRMEEFGINATNVVEINNLNLQGGGRADLAFLAYNRGSFDIKTPVFSQFPVSRFVCRPSGSSEVTFVSAGVVSGGATGNPQESLSYQWFKYNTPIPGATNSSYTLTAPIESSDYATYKVRISNAFGAVVASATLSEDGTPTFWDGNEWVLPPSYIAAGITVPDADRELIFSEDYSQESGVLEGCNCTVPSGSTVIFSANSTLKLYNEVVVEADGKLTIGNDASLIQTNSVTTNSNIGSIILEREALNTIGDDFIFWSSPVESFSVSNITSPFVAPTFTYDINAINSDGTAGDFISASEFMILAKGYSVQIPNEFETIGFTASFEGKAVNGPININVSKSPMATQPVEESRHWNLIGNPYPSAINVEEFLSVNTALEGNVRFRSNSNTTNSAIAGEFYTGVNYNYGDQYITYNRTGSTPDMFGGNIASGQGFFVQVQESASPVTAVNFNKEMRYNDAEIAYDNSQFIEANQSSSTPSSPDNQLVWLSLVNGSDVSSVALLGYVNGATNGSDRMYDAFSDGSEFRIYSTLEDSKLAIQGRALPFDNADTVPIGVDLPDTGSYTIGIDQLKGNILQSATLGIFLEDRLLDEEHDLKTGPYSFVGIAGSTLDRFILKYKEPLSVGGFDELNAFVFVKDDQLNVRASSTIKAITVYDITGKQIIVYTPTTNDTSFIAPFNFVRGMYITVIELGDENTVEVTRKLIN